MIRVLQVLTIVMLCAGNGFAGSDMIFYKYADGDGYSMYISADGKNPENPSARDAIAKRLQGAKFSLADISKDYYKINITPNIKFFGENITQYSVEPISEDRFSHIVWVSNCGALIKTEVYDTNKRLVFAFSGVNFGTRESGRADRSERNFDRGNAKHFYKGYYHAFTKLMPGGVLHMVFADGINKFSVFLNPNPTGDGAVSKIVYGNYLLSKVVSGMEYTVVGSVPYSFMEEIIRVMDPIKEKLSDVAEKGQPITEDLLNDKSEVKQELKTEDSVK